MRKRSHLRTPGRVQRSLHKRRVMARQARLLGFLIRGKGFYYDPTADCSYLAVMPYRMEQ